MHSQQLDCCHGNYRPNFLVFDEPSNHLDLETVKPWQSGVVLVSHDKHLIETNKQTLIYKAAVQTEFTGSCYR